MSSFAPGYGATVPSWLTPVLAETPSALPDDVARMRFVHALADQNHQEGTGGPFAALVVESQTGTIVSAGVNLVLASGLSSAHAEVVALSLAQTRLAAWDLGDPAGPAHELVVNWRPCVMCYGAAMWSGITRLVIAGSGPELEQLTGFDEGPMAADWVEQFERRGIEVVQDVLRDEALAVFTAYGARDDVLVYNARGSGAISSP
jgi:tRNA(Arg) A34 adenosine deaminase TadA